MTAWLPTLNTFSAAWLHQMARASLEAAIALTLVFLITLTFKRTSARIKCWWWRLAHLKLILSLLFLSPFVLPLLPAASQNQYLPSPITQAPITPTITPTPTRAPSAAPALPQHPNLSWPFILLILWLSGILISTANLIRAWRQASALRREANPVRQPALIDLTARLAKGMGFKNPPVLLASDTQGTALLVGPLSPAIIFPNHLLEVSSPSAIELIVTHELSHLARRDLWWNCLQSLAAIPFFFHPLVWFACSEWLTTQEIACDELTVITAHSSPSDYAHTLLEVLKQCRAVRRGTFAIGIGTFTQTTKRRMLAMRYFSPQSNRNLIAASTLIALVASIGLLPWRLVAQSPSSLPPPSPLTNSADPMTSATGTSTSSVAAPHVVHNAVAGTLIAPRVSLSPYVDGNIQDIKVTEGQHVKKGDPLITLDSRNEKLALQLAKIEYENLKTQFERSRDNNAGSKYELDQAENASRVAEVTLRKAELDLEKMTIFSPLDGIVTDLNQSPGEYVAKGKILMTIIDTTKLSVEARVSTEGLAQIHIGSPVQIQVDGYPNDHFDGEIIYISPTVEPSNGTCQFNASFKASSDKLKPGMFASVWLSQN